MSSTPFARAPRERPQPLDNRGSMLRASILESALELGVGSGGTVAKWMFSPVEEADEEADTETMASPSLTYASTATSEDSSRSQPGAGILLSSPHPPLSAYTSREGFSEGVQRIQFDFSPSPEPRIISPPPPSGLGSRFRKMRLNTNGDESDGGYISDAGKKKKEKKSRKKAKDDGNGTEHESDGGYFSEASRMQRKQTKKDKKAAKEKAAESPTTEYETDGGGAGRTKGKKKRSRKTSIVSPGTGDESDGGNISESSAKKKGFFRLNTRSRKKRDAEESPAKEVPPVPALPAGMLPLPIADRFLRSPTPMSELSRTTSDTSRTTSEFSRTTAEWSRTPTPLASSVTTPDEASVISYASTEPDAGSIIAREGLTGAFGDAKSIHRPSYDVLGAFRSPTQMPPVPNTLEGTQDAYSPSSRTYARAYDSPIQSPGSSPSKSKSLRPVISAPNTTMLNAKHIPAPLVLSSPTSIRSQAALHYPHTPGSDYVMITPQATPMANQTMYPTVSLESATARPEAELVVPSPSRREYSDNYGPPSPKASQSSLRPQVLAYYNIPPPTPPPQGPLPDVPPEPLTASNQLSRTMSADDMRARSPLARTPLSAARFNPPTRALPLTPVSAPMHPARSSSESDVRSVSPPGTALSVPVISEPAPRAQRGRVSPFPTAPVPSARALSPMFPRAESPALMTPMSAGPAMSSRVERMARYAGNKPASADDYAPSGSWHDPGRLDARWAPRSTSALEQRRPDAFDASPVRRKVSFDVEDTEDEVVYAGERSRPSMDDERSELNMGDDEGDMEPVVEGELEPVLDDDQSYYPEDDDRSRYEDSRPGTMYSEADGGDRYSMWSQSDGRRSFFDEEKSASTRDRFVKQVEKMYGEYKVPPVPVLDTRPMNRGIVG